MSPQKHLWSGDWERHSETPPAEPIQAPAGPPEAAPEPEPHNGRNRMAALAAIVVVLITVGVVLAITLPNGSKRPTRRETAQGQQALNVNPGGGNQSGGAPLQQTPPQQQTTTPQQPTTTPSVAQAPTPVQIGPTYSWLGMQVSATPNGVVVATVSIGGAADAAGINPGDVISQVNSTQIGSVADLQSAVKGLQLGTRFQLIVDRGTTPVTISATLTNRPKRQS